MRVYLLLTQGQKNDAESETDRIDVGAAGPTSTRCRPGVRRLKTPTRKGAVSGCVGQPSIILVPPCPCSGRRMLSRNFRSGDPEALAVALSLTSLLGVRAPGYSCRKSTIVDMSAGAAAGGAAGTSVGARSMRNYLKFLARSKSQKPKPNQAQPTTAQQQSQEPNAAHNEVRAELAALAWCFVLHASCPSAQRVIQHGAQHRSIRAARQMPGPPCHKAR
jgi:hypothetical protein